MASTTLLRRVPFDGRLRRLQELDWTLRCLEHDGVGLVYAPDQLVIWYADEHRPWVSFDAPWREQFEWLQHSRSRLTPRAYAALSMSAGGAGREGGRLRVGPRRRCGSGGREAQHSSRMHGPTARGAVPCRVCPAHR
jgi:hypothetical protein